MQLSNLKTKNKLLEKEIRKTIFRVMRSGFFIGGREVDVFEKKAKKFLKTKYAISVNSGTDALFLALKALGIKSSDEVITTPFTFIATAEVIANLGAKPVFADIKNDTFNIDPELIEKLITKKTKAIIPVHLFGRPADMEKITAIAKKYKVYVIEDAAQAFGVAITGDAACFSFFPSKNLGCFGDGGMVATNNLKIAEKIRLLKNHGSSKKEKYLNLVIGGNSRLDAIQAAILSVKLKYLKKWNQKRRDIAEIYQEGLKDIKEIRLPEICDGHVFNQYTLIAKKRNELKKYLEKNSIETHIYYSLPLHLQPAFKYLKYKGGGFPVSEKSALEVLSLPIYPEMTKTEQNFIIEKIKEFYL